MATVAFVVSSLFWVASFVPGAPGTGTWEAFLVPAFVSVFPVWAVVIADSNMRHGLGPMAGNQLVELTGWRRRASWILGLTCVLTFVGVFGGLAAPDGDDAAAARLFGGGVMVFAGMSVLALTQPEGGDSAPSPLPKAPHSALVRRVHQAAGVTEVVGLGRGSPDAIVGRLQAVAPVQITGRADPGLLSVHAHWHDKGAWPVHGLALRLDGEITATPQGDSTVTLLLQPANSRQRWSPVGAVVSMVGFLAVTIWILRSIDGISSFWPVLALFAVWMVFVTVAGASAGWRLAKRVRRGLLAAVAG